MQYIEINCGYCNSQFLKENRRFNESLKREWKFYCSTKCQNLAKTKRKIFQCSNPQCKKTLIRKLSGIPLSGKPFCSRSCSAIVNNPTSAKRRKKIRTCPVCNANFTGDRICCSLSCAKEKTRLGSIVDRDSIIAEIKLFYKNNGRVPFKKEYKHSRAARERFGTWNNAIIAAGFDPNPVKFAHKHVAKDGHVCDSLSEKIIDDWLYRNHIHHEIHVPYNKNNMSADFKIGNIFVEFIGLQGQHDVYDRQQMRKKQFWKENKLNVIEIYPIDLFPTNNLNAIFNKCVT